MKRSFEQMGVGSKLAVIAFLLVALIFGAFAVGIGYSTSSLIERRALDEITAKTKAVAEMVEVFNADLKREAFRLSKILEGYYPGQFTLDTASRVNVNGVMTPTLKNGGSIINLDFSIPDKFSSRSGVMATVLVKMGEEFVRITTSMKNDKGERAVGTRLDHTHPAYKSLLAGESYSGIATIFGREFFTQYHPVKDGSGQVIAALFVGIDFTEDAKSIKNNIRQIKIGQSGYFYILDSTPGAEYGNLVLHPSSEGTNILGSKDAKGREFIREILEKKQGTIVYPWKNQGESSARDKVVAYASVPSFEWVIGGGAYLDEVVGEAVRIRNVSLIAALIAVGALSFLLLIFIRRMVTQPLAEATNLAQQLAKGDLTVRIETHRNDEIGALIKAVNSIARGLANVVWNVRNGTETIATAASEVASGNQDLSSRTEQQASSLEETASSMEELTSTVRQNADSAHHANDMATEASDVAAKGGASMNEAVETMDAIHAASKKIADIITVIDGIAFQTNILALNAAVEAARAGEQGRGFAVVATEVRNLAQRSATAAHEIKALIDDSVKKVEEGSKLVHDAGDTMAEVVGSIQRVQGVMSEIAAATREQSDGIEQVNQAITQMDTVTQQNAALVEQAAAATEAMQNQTHELIKMIGFFKLNANKFGTSEEAVAMVKKGVESLKEDGQDVMFAEVNDKFGPYTDRDLYVVVYDMNGHCLAHGANPALIGKDLIDAKDGAGALYVKERVALVANQESAWQNYAFLNPISKQVEAKAMYLERVGELIVGCGVYR